MIRTLFFRFIKSIPPSLSIPTFYLKFSCFCILPSNRKIKSSVSSRRIIFINSFIIASYNIKIISFFSNIFRRGVLTKCKIVAMIVLVFIMVEYFCLFFNFYKLTCKRVLYFPQYADNR